MNILFLSRRFYPEIGGVEKHVLEIGRRLVKKDHRVTIIAENNSRHAELVSSSNLNRKKIPKQVWNDNIEIDIIEGIEVYRINSGNDDWFKKFRIWNKLWQLRNLINTADVVHCHDVFFWYLPFRFLYPKKPVFTTFHGYESYPIKKKSIIIRKISEKLSWGNICIGDFIQKWYGTKPTYVSYGAVRVENGKWKMENGKNKESAVFIGRLDEQTGIVGYVKVFEILKKRYPRFKFTVVGDGKYKKLIHKKVKVLGFKKNTDEYFKKFRFAFVSRYLSILEAFAAKKLVFALYDNPLKEDYLKMTPFSKFIITASNAFELARKIDFFIHNPDFEKKITGKSYKWVKDQTWKKMTEMYIMLWKKV